MARDHERRDDAGRPAEPAAPMMDAFADAFAGSPDVRVLMVEAAAVARPIIDNVRPEQWDARTCCTEWTVRQMVGHLTRGNEQTATALVGPTPPTSTVANDDPAAAFAASCERLQWAYAAPDALTATLDLPFGAVPAVMMARLRSVDMLFHAWDIARTTGQPTDYAPELNETALAISRKMMTMVPRRPGGFGPEQAAPDGASAADRLAAFLGCAV